jgi:hypothetical protein
LVFPPKQDRYWKGRISEIVEGAKVDAMMDEIRKQEAN